MYEVIGQVWILFEEIVNWCTELVKLIPHQAAALLKPFKRKIGFIEMESSSHSKSDKMRIIMKVSMSAMDRLFQTSNLREQTNGISKINQAVRVTIAWLLAWKTLDKWMGCHLPQQPDDMKQHCFAYQENDECVESGVHKICQGF
jgi:hypothetical protein